MKKDVAVLAILQARMSSTRLPGKVLKPILDKPMLALQIERILRARMIDQLVVATSDTPEDQAIADLCKAMDIVCFQGSLTNVLHRFIFAANHYEPEHIVRLTGDCPLISPMIIDQVITQHVSSDSVYTSNCYPPSFPDGLDVEVFTWTALKQADKETESNFDREHVSPYIRNTLAGDKQGVYIHDVDLSALRWTVDYPEDFERVTQLYEALYSDNPDFELQDILQLLEQRPELGNPHKGSHESCAQKQTLSVDNQYG